MNGHHSGVNQELQLPQKLLDNAPGQPLNDPRELVDFWRQIIECRNGFPNLQEKIAHFAVSIAASSLLVGDNDLFEAIHAEFGTLEVPQDQKNGEGWNRVSELLAQAEQKVQSSH